MSSAVAVSANTLKLAIPIGAGVISLAYLCAKLFNNENARTEYENEKVTERHTSIQVESVEGKAEFIYEHNAYSLLCLKRMQHDPPSFLCLG